MKLSAPRTADSEISTSQQLAALFDGTCLSSSCKTPSPALNQ
jgi:hypothetical protein